ncbi:MAG: MBL fold metallo-hydrolase [Deltaproteobacteria bacterium]|nr:MBL fold metallo-hydrolase [Deltaproteobacteria bacterium]
MVYVRREQFPVGQGGLHACRIEFDQSSFSYVYDCGSANRNALERQLESLKRMLGRGAQLDILAFSHLDDDHINGADDVLSAFDVDLVLAPYLEPWERLLLVGEYCANDRYTPSTGQLAADPGRYFTDRGARRVILVNGVAPPPGPAAATTTPRAPDMPPPENPQADRREIDARVSAPHAVAQGDAATPQATGKQVAAPSSVARIPSGHAIPISPSGTSVSWELVPHVFREPPKYGRFRNELIKILGLAPSTSIPKLQELARDALKTSSIRRAIGDAYRQFGRDRNRTSMSLYSGPVGSGWTLEDHAFSHKRFEAVGNSRVAWVGTGDALLTTKLREHALTSCLGHQRWTEVGTFVVPHHGSRHNFSPTRLKAQLDEEVVFVVPVGKNQYGHPDTALMSGLRARGNAVVEVRRRGSSRFREFIVIR